MNPKVKYRCSGDDGVALVMAMGVLSVVTLVIALMVNYALYTVKASGQDRQRTTSVGTAEAGVDATYLSIETAGSALPCSTSGEVRQAPRDASWSATIMYTSPLNPVPHCPVTAAEIQTSAPLTAAITSTGTTAGDAAGMQSSARAMQGIVNLRPKPDFGAAILSFGTLALDNRTRVSSTTGDPADVYSKDAFECSNNERFQGSVFSLATIGISNSCSVTGDVWASTGVSSANGSNGTLGGRVLTAAGNINLRGSIKVTGVLQGPGTISHSSCPDVQKCFPGAAVDPPDFPPAFPGLLSTSAALAEWQAAPGNYTVVNDAAMGITTCTDSAVATWIKAKASTLASNTLILTNCRVLFANTKDIALAKNLAIFTYKEVASQQQVNFKSTDSTTKNLYFIVPADTAGLPAQCATGNHDISTDNNFSTASTVNLLVYTPCHIDYSNSSTQVGQIYGGQSVTIRNQFTLDFRELPVYGVDADTVSAASYAVDIVAKREVRR